MALVTLTSRRSSVAKAIYHKSRFAIKLIGAVLFFVLFFHLLCRPAFGH